MNNLQIFNNDQFGQVRTFMQNGEPWFVAKDITNILGYQNSSKAINDHVDIDDKLNNETLSSLGQRGGWLINESGLYSLILSSKLPNAKQFKRWVTSEVLPDIRKYGGYNAAIPKTLPEALKAYANEVEEHNKVKALIEAQKPKVLFADAVSTSHTSILIGDLAKLLKQNGYETGQKRLFEQLRQEGYLIKSGSSCNMPTQKSMDLGLFEVKETTVQNSDGSVRITKTTKVTGKGQLYFINRYLQEKAS
ncbi:phage antirepressor KilAC domain-containing protein [Veillonella caviae]|uniref:phage antirepressor KilAC domain-containing protein n=2 Tax=Veillonella caviae TaxID=248316 RepID=UPI0023FA3FFF|nr:phage antirepressor KilAC domain-containing protein [Veillonella caviae]